jgi:4-aminobutyrate aminotransferase-like enzyme
VALAVLHVIEEEKLQTHAQKVGNYWINKVTELKQKFPIIGDVRYSFDLHIRNSLSL